MEAVKPQRQKKKKKRSSVKATKSCDNPKLESSSDDRAVQTTSNRLEDDPLALIKKDDENEENVDDIIDESEPSVSQNNVKLSIDETINENDVVLASTKQSTKSSSSQENKSFEESTNLNSEITDDLKLTPCDLVEATNSENDASLHQPVNETIESSICSEKSVENFNEECLVPDDALNDVSAQNVLTDNVPENINVDGLENSNGNLYKKLSAELDELSVTKQTVEKLNLRCIPSAPEECTVEEESPEFIREDAECSQHDIVQEQTMLPFTENQLLYLYNNRFLEENTEYIRCFIESQQSWDKHAFYKLLQEYLNNRNKSFLTSKQKEKLDLELKEYRDSSWKFIQRKIENQGKCVDGKLMSAEKNYTIAEFDIDSKEKITKSLEALRDTVNEHFSLNSFDVKMSYLKIESFIASLLNPNQLLSYQMSYTPYCYDPNFSIQQLDVQELKNCISILFSFQRVRIADDQFLADTRKWLSRLMQVFLKFALIEDHLFILNHVLRCPAGISEWAGKFLQPPPPPLFYDNTYNCIFGCEQLDICITYLSTILQPVVEREEFLANMCNNEEAVKVYDASISSDKDAWMVVDSDGEEDYNPSTNWFKFKDDDLLLFLNQVPFTDIFRHVLFITNRGNYDDYDVQRTNEQHFIKLIAFASTMIKLFETGIMTYSSDKYSQFNKKLCQLIKEMISLLADHYIIYKTYAKNTNLMRISVEFDQLFHRACKAIHSSTCHGSWQFLAELPFTSISLNMLWEILFMFNNPKSFLSSPLEISASSKFDVTDSILYLDDSIKNLSTTQIFYLLNTFANMAFSRDQVDKKFINAVAIEIFKVSYLCENTREMCSKEGMNLLETISLEHTFIISSLLHQTKANIEKLGSVSNMLIRLYAALPLHTWLPSEADFDVIISFLWKSSNTISNQLARVILTNMNWFLNADGSLFINSNFHMRLALTITKCCGKLSMEHKQLGIISQGYKQISQAFSNSLNDDQKFLLWVWEILPRLNLHICDCNKFPSNLTDSDFGCDIPDLGKSSDLKHLEIGISSKNPVDCYVALMLSSFGHRKSEICTNGFKLLKVLLDYQYFTPVLHVLSCIVPLFYGSPNFIISESFINIISTILCSDVTYFKIIQKSFAEMTHFEITKKLLAPTFPGTILKQFSAMILNSLAASLNLSKDISFVVIKLWLNTLMRVPNWNKDPNVLYIIDKIVCYSFFHKEQLQVVITELQDEFKNSNIQKSSGIMSSIVSWIAPTTSYLSNFDFSSFPWFSYCVLECVNKHYSELWDRTINILHYDSIDSAEEAFKKALVEVKFSSVEMKNLPIYLWAQLAEVISPEHSLHSVVWLKFFSLYFQRNSFQARSFGMKFFQSGSNLTFLKKLKQRLEIAKNFHEKFAFREKETKAKEQVEEEFQVHSSNNHLQLEKLMRTFLLWLEEPHFHEANIYLPSLSGLSNIALLEQLMKGNKDLWLDFIDCRELEIEISSLTSVWLKIKIPDQNNQQRDKKPTKMTNSNVDELRKHLLKQLHRFSNPEVFSEVADYSFHVPATVANFKVYPDIFHQNLQNLKEHACSYYARCLALQVLDLKYLEFLPELYFNQDKSIEIKKPCSKGDKCAEPASITLNFKEKHLDDVVKLKMEQNRSEYATKIHEAMMPHLQSMLSSAIQIENSVLLLVKTVEAKMNSKETDNVDIAEAKEIGLKLFYMLVAFGTQETRAFPPTNSFIVFCIETLGKTFVYNESENCLQLMETSLKNPHVIDILSSLFNPNCASSDHYISMYSKLSKMRNDKDFNIIISFLSKFDLTQWLERNSPRHHAIKEMLDIVKQILYSVGIYPDENDLMILDIYKIHLTAIFQYQFPEHYGNFLRIYFQGMDDQSIYDGFGCFILGLLGTEINEKTIMASSPAELDQIVRHFSDSQSLLTTNTLEETIQYFASHFMKIRVISNQGLYLKYKPYIPGIATYISLISFSLIADKVKNRQSQPMQQVFDKVWEDVLSAFSPWILPIKNNEEVNFPWVRGDERLVCYFMDKFVRCVDYMNEKFHVTRTPLAYLWNLYANTYAKIKANDVLLLLCHKYFNNLPWHTFFPNIEDIKLMINIFDFCHESKAFLLSIFSQVHWSNLIEFYNEMHAFHETQQIYSCFLELFVKFSSDIKTFEESRDLLSILENLEAFDWKLITEQCFNSVVSYFVTSCDPLCIIIDDNFHCHVLRFLQCVAEFYPQSDIHSERLAKQCCYLKNVLKLMNICAEKHPMSIDRQAFAYKERLFNLLSDVEEISTNASDDIREETTSKLFIEYFNILSSSNKLKDIGLFCLLQWISEKNVSLQTIYCTLRITGTLKLSFNHSSRLFEECIGSALKYDPMNQRNLWEKIMSIIAIPDIEKGLFIDMCIKNTSYYSVYVYIKKEQMKCPGDVKKEMELLNLMIKWFSKFNLSEENEFKVFLIFNEILIGILKLANDAKYYKNALGMILSFCNHLIKFGEDRATSGLRGAIGLGKKSNFSKRFRFICKALSCFIYSQLPFDTKKNSYSMRLTNASPDHLRSRNNVSSATKQSYHVLDRLKNNSDYGDLKEVIEYSLNFIHDMRYSFPNSVTLFHELVKILYKDQRSLYFIDEM